MRFILSILILVFSYSVCHGQTISKGAGVFYFNGTPPALTPNLCYDSETGIDIETGYWWEYSRTLSAWIWTGWRVQEIDTCAKPTYTPVDKQSEIVLNSCDSLYRWRAGAWYLLNGGGGDDWGSQVVIHDASLEGDGTTGSPLSLDGYSAASNGQFPYKSASGLTWVTVDTSNTNEAWTISDGSSSELVSNQTITFTGTGGAVVTYNTSTNTVTINAGSSTGGDNWGSQVVITDASLEGDGTAGTPLSLDGYAAASNGEFPSKSASGLTWQTVDLSATNEIQTYAHSGTTSYTNTLSNGGGSFTLQSGGIVTISHTTGTVTISATEVDGSTTNELQTLANSSDATSHTVTLSNSGGSVQMIEGTGITLTTGGTALNGTVTIAAADASPTNELQTLANSSDATSHTVTLSNGGGSMQLIEGTGITLTTGGTALDGTVTIAAVDGSATNELQTLANTSNATSHTVTLSNSGGSVQFVEGSGITMATTGTGLDGIVTITAVDASATNELQTLANTSDATSHTVTLSNSGGSVQFIEGSGITLTTGGTGSAGTVTVAALDASASNEIQTYSHSGTTSYTNTLSLGGGSFTLQSGGIVTISHTAGTTTISATEVDGSTTNELQTFANTSDATSHTVTLSNSGGSVQFIEGTGITLTTGGTGSAGTVTIAAADASSTNEIQTYSHSGTTSYTNTLSLGGGSFTLQSGGIVTISHTTGTVTISATEVDGSTTNELQTLANTSNATSHTVTLSSSGGSVQFVEGSGITMATTGTALDGIVTITATDASATNELQTFSNSSNATSHTVTLSSSGGSVQLVEGSGITMATTGTALDGIVTITATDASATNELQTYAHSGTTSYTNTLSNGGGSFTLQSGGIVTISHTTGTVTISATEVDGSTSNELQTFSNSSNATSHTVTLSSGGGSVQMIEGTGITLTTGGTALDGTVTIAATDASTTNELQTYAHSGTTSYTNTLSNGGGSFTLQSGGIVTLSHTAGTTTISATEVDGSTSNELQSYSHSGTTSYTNTLSNGGGSFTLQSGGIVTISHSAGTSIISATEADGSTTNELQTYSHSGTTSYTNTLSNGGGSFTLQSGGIVTISHTAGTTTISATEVDGSTSNELQTLANTSDATSHTVTLSNSGGSVQFIEGSGITLTTGGTGSAGTVTVAATDASTTNELQTYSHSGTTSYTNTLSNGGGSFTLQSGGIVSISHTAGTATISATEVDGSTTNELQTYAHSGTTSYTNTLSNGGGSFTLQSGGIVTLSHTAGTTTISATEVDGSTSNELQTYSHSGTTSYTNTLSNGGGSFTLQSGGIVTLSHTAGTTTISATEVDGSTSNELQTFSNSSNATSHTVTLSNSGGSVQLIEGTGITLTTGGTALNGTVTIAATGGGITAANNGLYISGGTTVRMGTNPLIEATIIDQDGHDFRHGDGKWSYTDQLLTYTPQGAGFGIEGTEAMPTTNTSPTKDGIIELRASSSVGSAQPNSLTIGAYPTDADGIWIQARSQANPSFEYPLSLQPRGEKMSVGRIGGLDALVTFAGTGLSGSGIAGQVLHLENSEGNGKTSMSLGAGTDALDSEIAWFDATDALRITNRSNTAGTSTVRVAIGGETSDVAIFQTSSTAPNSRFGIGFSNPANVTSTLQSGGSIGTAILTTVGAVTLDERHHVVIFTGNTNQTWTLPTASACTGRNYVLCHRNTTGTITLSTSVNKGNGGSFSTLAAGEWAMIWSDGSAWTGYKLTSL